MPLPHFLFLVLLGGQPVLPGYSPAPLPEQSVQSASATLLGYQSRIPSGWTSRPPSSNMRLAEYSAGRDGAEVVAYFFGPGQGGSIEANLARWKGQFSNPAGGPVDEVTARESSGAFPLTIAEYRGSYARGIGAGATADKALPNHMLLAVVADTPKGRIFFQMYGPVRAVEAQRAAYLGFVRALK
jgi:hypothetical protein